MITATELVRLRPTVEEDLGFVTISEGRDENARHIEPWTRGRHREALSGDDQAHLILEKVEDGEAVGFVILADMESPHGSVELRRILVTDKGRGYGRAALRLVKRLAFEELRAHRLWLDVKENNLSARRVYESEGFTIEGTLRECLKTGEGFESLVVMSMLERECQI